jgi:hypothetical protein
MEKLGIKIVSMYVDKWEWLMKAIFLHLDGDLLYLSFGVIPSFS